MRPIKFRGQRVDDKKWVYGDLISKPIHHECAILENGVINHSVIPETVGQYVGLKDKNGKEIFEADVIKWDDEKKMEYVLHSTDWDGSIDPNNAPFMSAYGSTCGRYFRTFMNIYDPTRFATIVGNIHTNPDLLQVTNTNTDMIKE
jgi:uncharacterized phage protein (TIGR01671 family)